ncbi:LysR family transcriptional regulator [Streptomyces sp. NPDC001985]|uniref:LysR family transcriptional regulator n=1 Tax=Streptomyces sp. NPDC001985 TaxID=3154406 RepID=UPI0033197CD9
MSDSEAKVPLAHRVPDLGALELLLAVARHGSLGRAARELGISQPAASARIRSMERGLGLALVDRSPRGSRLTGAGALVTDWARRVVEAAEAFDAGAQALRGQRDSRLRVAASMTIAEYLLPGWLIALRTDRPGTAVSLYAGNSAAVAERLLSGEADLGFVEGLAVPEGLDGAVIGHDRLVVVVAPGHPWAGGRGALTPGELAGTPLILRERGSGTRQVLDSALSGHGGLAEPLLELASTTAVKGAVMSGAGPAVLSELAVREEVGARRLMEVRLQGVPLRRALRAVWRRAHLPAGPARELLTLTTASPPRPTP